MSHDATRSPRRALLRQGAGLLAAGTLGPLIGTAPAAATASAPTTEGWSSWARPFRADSPWNSRPLQPVLGPAVIPPTSWGYHPSIERGSYSTRVYAALPEHAPMTVLPLEGSAGIWDPDAEQRLAQFVIPHWPPTTQGSGSGDGHADIIDAAANRVYSFLGLRQDSQGRWRAAQIGWAALDGRGFGDPQHYFQGARAAGVPTCGGLIRLHEVDDGKAQYDHALALSLDSTGLARQNAYVFPATATDWNAEWNNSGPIPMGALLMLPASFDEASIADPALRKIVRTLKIHGAYVVDRNVGTPYAIYAEIGAPINLHAGGWNVRNADDLQRIRLALRQVVGAAGWLDGDGRTIQPGPEGWNTASMRGQWQRLAGNGSARFDSDAQLLRLNHSAAMSAWAMSMPLIFQRVSWAAPVGGRSHLWQANATPGVSVRLILRPRSSTATLVDTGWRSGSDQVTITWPTQDHVATYQVRIQGVTSGTAACTLFEAGVPRRLP